MQSSSRVKYALLAATTLGMGFAAPAMAQEAAAPDTGSGGDIIVTAQRIEQRLQDVPISITVLNQAQLNNSNVQNLKDIAAYTPGLSVNNRNGSDATTFTIRGFFQEQRTTSTVGVFFADVVAPRGSGASFGGDGAGPGALFDLQNVQVLKGPQGTLFGRNVTGGAVLLVPRKPTGRFEGYVEGSYGNYDMKRVQAVVNVPVMDSFRLRVGIDRLKRDGYLKNIGNFGDGKYGNHGLGDSDYISARVSAVADLSPDVENYTIASYTNSKSNGAIARTLEAFPGTPNVAFFGDQSVAQLARENAAGFWSVSNRLPDSASTSETWQIINTTTWKASDSLTVKNIMSYGEFRGLTNIDLFGNYIIAPGVTPGTETPAQVRGFAFTHAEPTHGYTNAQSTFVEEFQLQGHPGDGKFTWQAGAYMELSDPLGLSGVQTASFASCNDVTTFNCSGVSGSFSLSATRFRDYAVYSQASYDITSQLKLTLGGRYTWDKVDTELHNLTARFGTPANIDTVTFRCSNLNAPGYSGAGGAGTTFPFAFADRFTACVQDLHQKTSAPTWLVDLDFKPIDNLLTYAKWSRGYRQGGLAIFGPDPIQPYDKEKVDVYEIGAKANWRGAMPGNFNIAAFYNDFSDQQLQFGVACVQFVPGSNPPIPLPGFTVPCAGNAAVLNAGKSRMYGVEVEGGISPFEGLRIDVAYAYLNARVQKIIIPAPGSLPPYNVFTTPLAKPCGGPMCDVIANSGPPHKVVLSGVYTLPLPDSVGKLSFGGTFIYTSRRRVVADGVIDRSSGIPVTSGKGIAPSSKVVNLNASWEDVAGLPIDASFFVTNLTNEHVILQINDNQARGFVSGLVGEPRMFGGRLRYKFGG